MRRRLAAAAVGEHKPALHVRLQHFPRAGLHGSGLAERSAGGSDLPLLSHVLRPDHCHLQPACNCGRAGLPAHAQVSAHRLCLLGLEYNQVYAAFSSLCSWSFSGSTQSMRLKKLYYETLLEQEVAWFDSIDVGRLAAKVAKNISTIESAIG